MSYRYLQEILKGRQMNRQAWSTCFPEHNCVPSNMWSGTWLRECYKFCGKTSYLPFLQHSLISIISGMFTFSKRLISVYSFQLIEDVRQSKIFGECDEIFFQYLSAAGVWRKMFFRRRLRPFLALFRLEIGRRTPLPPTYLQVVGISYEGFNVFLAQNFQFYEILPI